MRSATLAVYDRFWMSGRRASKATSAGRSNSTRRVRKSIATRWNSLSSDMPRISAGRDDRPSEPKVLVSANRMRRLRMLASPICSSRPSRSAPASVTPLMSVISVSPISRARRSRLSKARLPTLPCAGVDDHVDGDAVEPRLGDDELAEALASLDHDLVAAVAALL